MTTKNQLANYFAELCYTYGLKKIVTNDSTIQSLTPYTMMGNDIHITVGRHVVVLHNIRRHKHRSDVKLALYVDNNNELVNTTETLPDTITQRFMDGLHEVVTQRERIF